MPKYSNRIVILFALMICGLTLAQDVFEAININSFALALLKDHRLKTPFERMARCPDEPQAKRIPYPNTSHSDIQVLVGTAYWIDGQCERAAHIWQQVITEDAKQDLARYWLGFYDYLENNFNNLRESWSSHTDFETSIRVQEIHSGTLDERITWSRLNYFAFPSGTKARRLELYYLEATRLDELPLLWNYLISTSSINMPDYWLGKGKIAELELDLDTALEFYSTGSNIAGEKDEYLIFNEARVCYLLQDYTCSLILFQKYLELIPRDLTAIIATADSAVMTGNPEIAVIYYQRALELDGELERAIKGLENICSSTQLCETELNENPK